MAFPPYRLPPTVEPKIEANELYGKPMFLFAGGAAQFGGRVLELIEIDPDQEFTVVVSLVRKTTGK